MNQDQNAPQSLPAAPFPAPPPFWKNFTTSNIDQLKEQDTSRPLPFHLACLRPPPPPTTDAKAYTTFSVEQSLSTAPPLPPTELLLFDPSDANINHGDLLSKLTNSLLLNFLEFMTVMGNDPTQYTEKMEDINTLMINAHAVINMYRPHQAREGVREMLEAKLDDGRKEIEICDAMKNKVEAFLGEVQQWPSEEKTTKGDRRIKKGMDQDTRRVWKMLYEFQDD